MHGEILQNQLPDQIVVTSNMYQHTILIVFAHCLGLQQERLDTLLREYEEEQEILKQEFDTGELEKIDVFGVLTHHIAVTKTFPLPLSFLYQSAPLTHMDLSKIRHYKSQLLPT